MTSEKSSASVSENTMLRDLTCGALDWAGARSHPVVTVPNTLVVKEDVTSSESVAVVVVADTEVSVTVEKS